MKLIWTKSNRPLSVLIRWILNTDCSHFAIVFNSPAGGLMFQSNLLGTHPKFYKTAQKSMAVVHEINLDISVDQENKIWDIIVDKYDGKSYDFGAFLYFGWRALLRKIFKKPLPTNNPWAKEENYLCDEIYEALEDIAPKVSLDLSITPPCNLYKELKDIYKIEE